MTLLDQIENRILHVRYGGKETTFRNIAQEVARITLYNVIRAEAARDAGEERPELKLPPDDWGGTPVR